MRNKKRFPWILLVFPVIGLLLAIVAVVPARGAALRPETVVTRFYRWHIDYPGNVLVERAYQRSQYLTSDFVQKVDRLLGQTAEEGGFDPFLCAQDIPATFAVSEAVVSGNNARVVVHEIWNLATPNEAAQDITVELRRLGTRWKISGVLCPEPTPLPATPETVVERFYSWYLNYARNSGNPLVGRIYRSSEYLSSDLVQKVDRFVASVDGPRYDPFLCAQDIPTSFTVDEAELSADTASVVVRTSFQDHNFTVVLLAAAGEWKINDVVCSDVGPGDLWQTFQDDDYAFQIDYPADWRVREARIGASLEDIPVERILEFFPQDWRGLMAPVSIEVGVGRLEQLQGVWPVPGAGQGTITIVNGNRALIGETPYGETFYIFAHPFAEDLWVAVRDSTRVVEGGSGMEPVFERILLGFQFTGRPSLQATPTPLPTPVVVPTPVPVAPTPVPTRVPVVPTPVPTAVPTPVSPPRPPVVYGWLGEYFGNRNLTGTPVLDRDDAAVKFDWGYGAPADGLPTDGFSVRWTRSASFEKGTYRFYVHTDDGVRVWLDGQLIIDQWHDASGVTYSVERTLAAAPHSLRIEYYENSGGATIRFWWERLSDFPQWQGEYFPNIGLYGSPVVVRNDAAIDFNWGANAPTAGLPADNFSARWTRKVQLEAGTYRFHMLVDDGARLWLGNWLLLDSWQDGRARELTVDSTLVQGEYDLRVEYYERTGDARIHVWWEKVSVYPDWKGEYWDNRHLEGSPVLVRNDKAIDFNWGSGAPAAGLPADKFSVRWTRVNTFNAGRYRFHAIVDDAVRLWVDDVLVIDAWQDGERRELMGDRTLSAGNHNLRVEYYERTGDALIRVWWESIPEYPDWKGEYWDNRHLQGSPVLVRNEEAMAFFWGQRSPAPGIVPADAFSARWTRTKEFDADTYRFYLLADDGARLWVDDRLLIDAWQGYSGQEVTADCVLVRGKHTIRVEYTERNGEAYARLLWERVPPSDWRGEYWDNLRLEGAPFLVRNDVAIDFDWGARAPTSGLPTDKFSVRWSRQATFAAGTTYRFNARADDGIRFYLDGQLILNEWHDASDEVYAAVLPLEGTHSLTVEYFDRSGDARVKFWWEPVGAEPPPTPVPPTPTPKPTPPPAPTPTPPALANHVRLNEVLVVASAVDWNGDGTVDGGDQWIELYNARAAAVNLGGWILDSGKDSKAYRIPDGTVVQPGEYLVLYGKQTGILLRSDRGKVRLLRPDAEVADRVDYDDVPADASYSRDAAGVWHADWPPSPGAPNQPPSGGNASGVQWR